MIVKENNIKDMHCFMYDFIISYKLLQSTQKMTGLSLCGVLSGIKFCIFSPRGEVTFIITQWIIQPEFADLFITIPDWGHHVRPLGMSQVKNTLLLEVFPPQNADVKCKFLAENILLLVFIISALILLSHNAIILTRLQGRDAQTYQLP